VKTTARLMIYKAFTRRYWKILSTGARRKKFWILFLVINKNSFLFVALLLSLQIFTPSADFYSHFSLAKKIPQNTD
jgi:hypothetical protein